MSEGRVSPDEQVFEVLCVEVPGLGPHLAFVVLCRRGRGLCVWGGGSLLRLWPLLRRSRRGRGFRATFRQSSRRRLSSSGGRGAHLRFYGVPEGQEQKSDFFSQSLKKREAIKPQNSIKVFKHLTQSTSSVEEGVCSNQIPQVVSGH